MFYFAWTYAFSSSRDLWCISVASLCRGNSPQGVVGTDLRFRVPWSSVLGGERGSHVAVWRSGAASTSRDTLERQALIVTFVLSAVGSSI